MQKGLNVVGNILAVLGLLICFIAGMARVVGNYEFYDFEAMTLFNVGVGLMVAACLAKLQQLLEHRRQ